MQRISFDREWNLSMGNQASFFSMQENNEVVNLPHDCNIGTAPVPECPDGPAVGFFKGTMAVYTKSLYVPEEWKNQMIYLELDGVCRNAEITVNGHQVGLHPNEYAPYICNLTNFLKVGEENRISIFANHSMERTARWYSGTGIYRHVDLRIAPKLHLTANPLFLSTERIEDGFAMVKVNVEAENLTDRNQKVYVKVSLYEDKGHSIPHGEKCVAEGTCVIYIPAGKKAKGHCTIYVDQPKLWDLENPNLYVAEVELLEAGTDGKWDDSKGNAGERGIFDKDQTIFGIRTITMDVRNGMRLNGKTIKLAGGCVHHDQGILGVASFYDSEYRKMKIHKDHGFHAIRCAHNPMSRDMMEACDRLGLLIFAEAFDVWRMSKNANDYHLFFDAWWERDLTAFIERDRNHPCIFCWSIGNEVTERNGLNGGAEISAMLAKKVRELDPTRPVSGGVPTLFNGMDDWDAYKQWKIMMEMGGPGQNMETNYADMIWADRTESFCAPLDLIGYNYLHERYEEDHNRYPDRMICGTETFPDKFDLSWEETMKCPHVIGDFVWTSMDYLGEIFCGHVCYEEEEFAERGRKALQTGRPFPTRTANIGCFDICGNEKPYLYFRKAVIGDMTPYIAVHHPKNFGKMRFAQGWAWEECSNDWYYPGYEGKPVKVEIYSHAEEVGLLLNGESLGKKISGKKAGFRTVFETIYTPGILEAAAYQNGKEISRQQIETHGAPAAIRIVTEKECLKADGQSLAYCTVEIVDKEGRRISDAEVVLHAEVKGAATLAAFGSSKSETAELYTTGTFTTYQGRLQAILRSRYEAGEAVLMVSGEGFETAKINIIVK